MISEILDSLSQLLFTHILASSYFLVFQIHYTHYKLNGCLLCTVLGIFNGLNSRFLWTMINSR